MLLLFILSFSNNSAYKVIIVGECGVGKTLLQDRFVVSCRYTRTNKPNKYMHVALMLPAQTNCDQFLHIHIYYYINYSLPPFYSEFMCIPVLSVFA